MSLCIRSRRKSSKQEFPLDSLSISGRVEGLALLLCCEYSYTNTLSDKGVEVEFVFPTPTGATVCGLSGEIDGRKVEGEIRERGEARDSYDDAISSGYSAGIVEQAGKINFRMLLGNLSPNGRALLRITFLSELELNIEGVAILCIPAAMLPKFNNEQIECKFSFELYIEKRVGEFSFVESNTHKISYSKESNGEIVRIKEGLGEQHKDIEILMKPSFTNLPLISTHGPVATPPNRSHRYMSSHACMLTFIPKLNSESTSSPSEFIFIIDRSGSMSGSRIKHAKSTLELLLQSLTIGCYFNIIGFGSSYELLSSSGSLEYTQETLESSLKAVRELQANLGGTYLLPPLKEALDFPVTQANLPRQIMVLTDGNTKDVSEIIKMVESSPQTFRVFSFGIGADASRSLVSGLAEAGRGKAVYLKNATEMERKVLHIMNLAFSPDLRDIEIEFSHPTEFFPPKIPNLFLNERMIVYGFITDLPVPPDTQIQAKLSFRLEGNKETLVSEFYLTPDALTPHGDLSMVHLLGSSLALRAWDTDKKRKEECTQLSCASGIMCKYTAYVITDPTQSDVVNAPLSKLTADAPRTLSLYNSEDNSSDDDEDMQCEMENQALIRRRLQSRQYVQKKSRTTLQSPRCRPRSPPIEQIMKRSRMTPDHDTNLTDTLGTTLGVKSKKKLIAAELKHNISPVTGTDSTQSSYQSITCLQRAEGSWEYSGALEGELKLDLKVTCPVGVNLTLWVSVVCIACLRVNFSAFQTQWLLVVKKGENWVKQELSKSADKLSYEELSESAKQIISQQ